MHTAVGREHQRLFVARGEGDVCGIDVIRIELLPGVRPAWNRRRHGLAEHRESVREVYVKMGWVAVEPAPYADDMLASPAVRESGHLAPGGTRVLGEVEQPVSACVIKNGLRCPPRRRESIDGVFVAGARSAGRRLPHTSIQEPHLPIVNRYTERSEEH